MTVPKTAGIYKIYNKLNNRIYIGQAKSLYGRKLNHFWCLKNNIHANKFLQHDYNKCGRINFVFEVILETDCLELLNDFEQSYVDEYWDSTVNCYNIARFVDSPFLGLKHSDETLRLRRKREPKPVKIKLPVEGRKGKVMSSEARLKISQKNKGRKRSHEFRQKMSELKIGKTRKTFSEEHKKKLGESKKGRIFTDEHKEKLKLAWMEKKLKKVENN